jgi:putative membrane-bound dehydrogenase-like protein
MKKFPRLGKLLHHYCPLLLSGLLIISSCQKESASGSAIDPLSTFELEPGFKIELLAGEPLVGDPVDMEIDEFGRLYVVEMPGYPLDKSGSGKINILSDTDGDGFMDKSTVFAEGLVLPNSIMRWKKGVIVADAPHVLYFEDSDGDGSADVRDTLLTGFALSNPQHNLNNPLLGIDNWIYLAHEGAVGTERYKNEFGDVGTEIFFPEHPQSPRLETNAGERSLRLQPDQFKLEMTSSHSQFGHTFDIWGHHFQVENWNHIYQEVIGEPYLKRNRDMFVSDATQPLPDHGQSAEVFPITQNPQHQLLTDVGFMTSACGLTAYQGGAFPDTYNDVVFVAEPVSNLVHADRLKDKGASFTASRLRPYKEFLASTDARFRPVNMYIGPDGALYIVDYYRLIIEHPEWMSEEVVNSGKLYDDSNRGRIYRITSNNSTAAEWTKGLKLGDATIDQLVEYLSHPNGWWRVNAQRLLIDRADKAALESLGTMANHPTQPLGRLHALWTLEGMGALQSEQIEKALTDPVAGVRENAIRLAELHLAKEPQLTKALFNLQKDADPKVRFQLILTLGFLDSEEASKIRHALLLQDVEDEWVQIAALSASSSQASALLNVVLGNFKKEVPAYASLVRRLTSMIGAAGDQGAISQLIQRATNVGSDNQSEWQGQALEGLALGLENKKMRPSVSEKETKILINTFFDHPSSSVRRASMHLLKVTGIKNEMLTKDAIGKAVAIIKDKNQGEDKRAEAIDFISLRDPSPYAPLLTKLITPTEALSIQLASLRTLSGVRDTSVSRFILAQWSVLTPEVRDATVKSFLLSDQRMSVLLDAIERGTIQTSEISWHRKVALMNQPNDVLRKKAIVLFTENNNNEVNAAYQKALELKGDGVAGQLIYQKQCALCHQIRGKGGVTLGPDLGTVHNWSKEAILANILAPNQSISSGYDLWSVTLNSGESIQGIIASETPGAITLRNSGSPEKTIRRQDIKSIKALTMSAMPSGLDKMISVEEMANLLAYLKENK